MRRAEINPGALLLTLIQLTLLINPTRVNDAFTVGAELLRRHWVMAGGLASRWSCGLVSWMVASVLGLDPGTSIDKLKCIGEADGRSA